MGGCGVQVEAESIDNCSDCARPVVACSDCVLSGVWLTCRRTIAFLWRVDGMATATKERVFRGRLPGIEVFDAGALASGVSFAKACAKRYGRCCWHAAGRRRDPTAPACCDGINRRPMSGRPGERGTV